MSARFPPLTCIEVKAILKSLGFKPGEQRGSHQHWTAVIDGRFRKVTVDCPKAPFGHILIANMASQAGVTKKAFYAAIGR